MSRLRLVGEGSAATLAPYPLDHRKGFAKLPRDVVRYQPLFQQPGLLQLYVWLLAHAHHEGRVVKGSNGPVHLRRGQLIVGARRLATMLRSQKSTVQRRLRRLEGCDLIVVEPSWRGTVVTVLHFGEFSRSPDHSRDSTAGIGKNDDYPLNQAGGYTILPRDVANYGPLMLRLPLLQLYVLLLAGARGKAGCPRGLDIQLRRGETLLEPAWASELLGRDEHVWRPLLAELAELGLIVCRPVHAGDVVTLVQYGDFGTRLRARADASAPAPGSSNAPTGASLVAPIDAPARAPTAKATGGPPAGPTEPGERTIRRLPKNAREGESEGHRDRAAFLDFFAELFRKNLRGRPTWRQHDLEDLDYLLNFHGLEELEARAVVMFLGLGPKYMTTRDLDTFLSNIDKFVDSTGAARAHLRQQQSRR